MKAYWGSGDINPRILDLGTRWRWVVSFMPYLHETNTKANEMHKIPSPPPPKKNKQKREHVYWKWESVTSYLR